MTTNTESQLDALIIAAETIWRENRCLKESSIAVYQRWIRRFNSYCKTKRLNEHAQLTLIGVSAFARWFAHTHDMVEQTAFYSARSALRAWAFALTALGEQLPPWRTPDHSVCSKSPIIRDFADYLRQHRGNPEVTVHKKVKQIGMFMAFLRKRGRRLTRLRLQDIDAYIAYCCKRYAHSTTADICSGLRAFIRYLRVCGRISIDFSSSIMTPKSTTEERPAKTLPWDDVCRILHAIDRETACGRRDYALLLMMSLYGLGAGEIIRLRLDDIDWTAQSLHVTRPKTGVEFVLPILPTVAEALADYLRHGRPVHTQTRHLFVTMTAPHKRLACSTTIRHILHTHAHAAGVIADFLGTHVLRHTHACRQMELGLPPKIIGDILGHQDPKSTSKYLRVSIERLRELALDVPL